jgi:short-subunit dehydrogenase
VLGFLPIPFSALYSATKHAVAGYSESLDHELRTRGVRVSVIEPAYTKTGFDANFLAADAMIDEYRDTRAGLDKVLASVMATAGGLANRLRLLRRFAPTHLVDAGIRKDLRLDRSGA